MVARPENTEEETERTFEFIRDLKRINPETEVVVYIYTPLPDESRHESDRRRRPPVPMRDLDGRPVVFPKTAEEWAEPRWVDYARSEEHTSELQSLMRISYAVFCLKKKNASNT